MPATGDTNGRRRTRRNGEGNIRQRKDGRWEARVWVFTTDGREVRRSIYGATYDEVRDALVRQKADTLAGVRVSATALTVGDYLDFWLTNIAAPRVRLSTLTSYRWLANTWIVPYLGTKKLARLRPMDIRTFLAKLKNVCQCCARGKDAARVARGQAAQCCASKPPRCCHAYLSDGSVRYAHRLLRAALEDAVADDLLTSNPAKGLKISHRYRAKFTPWTSDEATRFLSAAKSHRWYALYGVALSLGLRRGEALALRWSDLDLTDGVIRVRQTLQRTAGQLRFGPVKTDGSDREVAVPPKLLSVLRRHQLRQQEEREAAGERWQENGLLFTTKIGTPIEPRNLNRHFYALCERAGVRRIRIHDLRHSCATMLYDQGVTLDRIQDVLGHSSPNVNKTIYVEATRRVQQDAVDRLGFLFDE